MPNVMVALPNIGGASVQCCKIWLMPSTRVSCSNAAKKRNPVKLVGVPQTNKTISAASRPILSEHVEDILLLNKFFPIVDVCLSWRRYSPTKLCYGAQQAHFWRFFRPVFSVSRVQHISDLLPKFTLRPHHVWKYDRHSICDGWD